MRHASTYRAARRNLARAAKLVWKSLPRRSIALGKHTKIGLMVLVPEATVAGDAKR